MTCGVEEIPQVMSLSIDGLVSWPGHLWHFLLRRHTGFWSISPWKNATFFALLLLGVKYFQQLETYCSIKWPDLSSWWAKMFSNIKTPVLYLFLQEELAFMFEMLGLHEDALVQYDELDALFTQFILNHAVGGKCLRCWGCMKTP